MFLGLGGSRRRAQGQGNGGGVVVVVPEFGQAGFQGAVVAGNALQALATGKYASSSSSSSSCQERLMRSKSLSEDPVALYEESFLGSKSLCEDPVGSTFGVGGVVIMGSPRSTLPATNLSRETSRGSGDSGVSGHGEDSAMSRDCSRFEGSRQSQALALAKKLKHTLGSKFADSLRETIKEVTKREKVENCESDACPQLVDGVGAITDASRSEGGVVGRSPSPDVACWPVEVKNENVVTALDHSSALLPFSSVEGLTTLDVLARSESDVEQSTKPISGWLCQENLITSQLAMAELSCSPWDANSRAQAIVPSTSSSMEYGQFFTSGHYFPLLGPTGVGVMSLDAVNKQSGVKGQWMGGFTSSRSSITRPAGSRRRAFPEAAAMGIPGPEVSHLRHVERTREVSTVGRYKDQSLQDVLKGIQTSGHGTFLGFHQNSLHPSNHESLLEVDARQSRFYGQPVAADVSCEDPVLNKMSGIDWRGNESTAFSSGAPLLQERPESGPGGLGFDGPGVKRIHNGGGVQSSKRQCLGSANNVLLDAPLAIDGGGGGGVKSEGEFKDFLANLGTARESAFEPPGSSLADLLDDLSQDLLPPQA